MRQRFKSIDPDLAHASFSYDPVTGLLIWKHRPYIRKETNSRFAGKVAGHRHTCTVGKTYIQVRVHGVMHYAHRIAWVMLHGPIPDGMEVDHQDGDGTNNAKSNLRLVTNGSNKKNSRLFRTNTSGFTGVYKNPNGTFYVRAWVENRQIEIGNAATAEEGNELRLAFNRENGFHANHGTERPL